MAKKDTHNDPKKPNLKILQSIRVAGKPVAKGAIVSKKDFPNKASWQNLAHMKNPRVEETDEKVQDAPAAKDATEKKAGGKSQKMPGA